MPRRPLVRLLAIAALLALTLLVAASFHLLDGIIPDRCTVGLAGAAVSVGIDGAGAGAACDDYAYGQQLVNGGSWYRYRSDTAPGGAVICQVALSGRTYTVRDQGLVNAYGSQICQRLFEAAGMADP